MKNLKELRKQHGLSQQKLADILHVSQQSIYKYEHDITSPDLETLSLMAKYFDTSVDYIIGITDVSHRIENIVDTMLNEDELNIITKYRRLDNYQKDIIHMVADSYLR